MKRNLNNNNEEKEIEVVGRGCSNSHNFIELQTCILCKMSDILLSGLVRNTSSRPEMFFNIGTLKIFVNFTGKHLCRSLFFDKAARFFHRTPPENCF